MSNNRNKAVYIYVGIEKSRIHSNKMNVSVLLDGKNIKPLIMPVIPISFKTETNTCKMYHYATLYALKYTLNQLVSSDLANCIFYFYPNNEMIYKEYNNDFLKTNKFKNGTFDLSLWNEIISILQKNELTLNVMSKKSILSGLGKIERNGEEENG